MTPATDDAAAQIIIKPPPADPLPCCETFDPPAYTAGAPLNNTTSGVSKWLEFPLGHESYQLDWAVPSEPGDGLYVSQLDGSDTRAQRWFGNGGPAGSFRILLNATDTIERSAGILLGSTSIGPLEPGNASMDIHLGAGADVLASNGTGPLVDIGDYQADGWVAIDIDFDGTGQYQVCVNGFRAPGLFDYQAGAANTSVNLVALYAGDDPARTTTAGWDDMIITNTLEDFCRDTPGNPGLPYGEAVTELDLLSDAELRALAVSQFCTCIVSPPDGFRACPYSLLEIEQILAEDLANKPLAEPGEPPVVHEDDPEPIRPIPLPGPGENTNPTFDPIRPEVGTGADFPGEPKPKPVPGPDLPQLPAIRFLDGPGEPAPVTVPTEAGPAFPDRVPLDVQTEDCPTCQAVPEFAVSSAAITPPEIPIQDVVVPVEDHPFVMNWTYAADAESWLSTFVPFALDEEGQAVLAEVYGALMEGAPAGGSGWMGDSGAGPESDDDTPEEPSATDDNGNETMDDADGNRTADNGTTDNREADNGTTDDGPTDSPDDPGGSDTLVTYLTELLGVDLSAPDRPAPLVFEVHTESKNVTKRTLATPLLPTLIDVDDNATTGILGFDVAVRFEVGAFLDEIAINITRLAPYERMLPDLTDPTNNTPLDLTVYSIVPLGLPSPVDTLATPNPDDVFAVAVGYTTQGQDAPAAVQLGVKADDLVTGGPNSRFEIGLDTWHALDNFTLLAGTATLEHVGPEAEDANTTTESTQSDLLDALPVPVGPVTDPINATIDTVVDTLAGIDPAVAEFLQRLVDTTRYRTAYRYEANESFVASTSFQPPSDHLLIDLTLPTQTDANSIVRIGAESDMDTRIVMSEETGLLTNDTVRNLSNLRVDKLPRDLVVTIHDDPVVPTLSVDYQADHPVGRIHAIQANDFRFPDQIPANETNATARAPVRLPGGQAGDAMGVFHLNISDLPKQLTIRLENGTDVYFAGDGPIGRIEVVAANGTSPAAIVDEDGLFLEVQESGANRFGLRISGLESYRLATHADNMSMEWKMLGDQPFLIDVSQAEPNATLEVRGIISNLPGALYFATDGSSQVVFDADRSIRDFEFWMRQDDATNGLTELWSLVEDLPSGFEVRFDAGATAGDVRFLTDAPIGDVEALLRSEPTPGEVQTLRVHVASLPGLHGAWRIEPEQAIASFDAEGDGIELIELQIGGTAFLDFQNESRDHVLMVQNGTGYPGAPHALTARITDLKHASVSVTNETQDMRVESARPKPFRFVVDTDNLTLQGAIDRVPEVVDLRMQNDGDGFQAIYEASAPIDAIDLCGKVGDLELWVAVRDLPARLVTRMDPAGNAEWRTDGRLGSVQMHLKDEGGIALGFPRVSALIEEMPQILKASFQDGNVTFDTLGDGIGLVKVALHEGDAAPYLGGLGLYYVESAQPGLPAGISARVPGFSGAQMSVDQATDTIDARLDLLAPTPVHMLYNGTIAGGPADVRVALRDLSEDVRVRIRGSNVTYEASRSLSELDVSADFEGLAVQSRLEIRDLPARFDIDIDSSAEEGAFAYTADGVLRRITADVRLPDNGTWQRARAELRDIPSQVYATWSDSGVAVDTGSDHVGSISLMAAGSDNLSTIASDHVLLATGANGTAAPFPVPDGPALSLGVSDFARFVLDTTGGLRVDVGTAQPVLFQALVSLPEHATHAALAVDRLPSSFTIDTDLVASHLYEASSIVRNLNATFVNGNLSADLRIVDLPGRLAFTMFDDVDAQRARFVSSSILDRIVVDVRDPGGIVGGLDRVRLQIDRLPAEAEVEMFDDGFRFRAFENPLGALWIAANRNAGPLWTLGGDHALLQGDGTDANQIDFVSARITDLREASFRFSNETGLRATLEKDQSAPFLAYADAPAVNATALLSIEDVPESLKITSDLESRHLYEASAVISRIDAAMIKDSTTVYLGVTDLPARMEVLTSSEVDRNEVFVLASSRLHEIRLDVHDPTGINGTDWKRVYAKVQGLPNVLSLSLNKTGVDFGTEHSMIALVEAAATERGDGLLMLPGDHVYYAEPLAVTTCDKECQASGGTGGYVAGPRSLSARLHGLEGARADWTDGIQAQLETRDHRPFLAFVDRGNLTACLLIEDLPTFVDVNSDLESEHHYDASSIINKVLIQAVKDNDTMLYLRLLDVPQHIGVLHEFDDQSGGTARVWTDTPVRDVLLEAMSLSGFGDSGLRRVRAHVADLPQTLTFRMDKAGGDMEVELDSNGQEIGLVEVAASSKLVLSDLAGDHALMRTVCTSDCHTDMSARISHLVGARVTNTSTVGLDAYLEFRDPRPFRLVYENDTGGPKTLIDATFVNRPARMQFMMTPDADHISYTASDEILEIRLDAVLGSKVIEGRIQNLPAHIDILMPAGTDDDIRVQVSTSSHLGSLELSVADPNGLHEPQPGKPMATFARVRLENLPTFLDVKFSKQENGVGDKATYLEVSTDDQGIGAIEVGVSTFANFQVPALVSFGNQLRMDVAGDDLAANVRIEGFRSLLFEKRFNGDTFFDVRFDQARKLDIFTTIDGELFTGVIDKVPQAVSVHYTGDQVLYEASSPIRLIEFTAVVQNTAKNGDVTAYVRVEDLPQSVLVKIGKETVDQAGTVHQGGIDVSMSAPIGRIKAEVDMEHTKSSPLPLRLQADLRSISKDIYMTFGDAENTVDLKDGLQELYVNVTRSGSFLGTAGLGEYVKIKQVWTGLYDSDNDDKRINRLEAASVHIRGIKMVTTSSVDDRTDYGLEFTSQRMFPANSPFKVIIDAPDKDLVDTNKEISFSNLPQRVDFFMIGDGFPQKAEYHASHVISSLKFHQVKGPNKYITIELTDVPTDITFEFRKPDLNNYQTWWGLDATASTTVNAEIHFYLLYGDMQIDVEFKRISFKVLKSPWNPSTYVIGIKFPFQVAVDTGNEPLVITLKFPKIVSFDIGQRHFKVGPLVQGRMTADNWLYSIDLKLGLVPLGISIDGGTVGGHLQLGGCVGLWGTVEKNGNINNKQWCFLDGDVHFPKDLLP